MENNQVQSVTIEGRRITPELVRVINRYVPGIGLQATDMKRNIFMVQNLLLWVTENTEQGLPQGLQVANALFDMHEFIEELEELIRDGKF